MKGFSKRTMIGGILALSLVLAGTGYAYWTDTLNVTTKATTGEFDVTFVDLGLYAQYGSDANIATWSIYDGIDAAGVPRNFFDDNYQYNLISPGGQTGANADYRTRANGFNEVSFNAQLLDPAAIKVTFPNDYNPNNALGSDRIQLDVNNIYPGYAQLFRSDIINNGNVAAKLSQLSFDLTEIANVSTSKMLGVSFMIDRDDNSHVVYDLAEHFNPEDIFEVGGVEFVRLSALDGTKVAIEETVDALLKTVAVPMSRMDLFVGVAMDCDQAGDYTTGNTGINNPNGNDDAATQGMGAVISIDLGWDQFNAELSAPPA